MLEGWERKHQLHERLLAESHGFRKFYQAMLLKMVRDTKLLESSPETMQKFRTINETLEVHSYQKEIVKVLEHIELDKVMLNHTNSYCGQKEALEKI